MRNIKEDINRVVTAFICYALVLQPMVASAEGIKALGSGGANPTITQTSLGIPQINITKPSAAGVSRNQYSDFNVSHYGAVFNNSTKDTQSTLGGGVRYNPNLKGSTAKVILNEVRSTRDSKLNGYMEVAGTKADVIIANPNGITCNGCGFVNIPNATLTTGQAQLDSKGNVYGYSVNQGNIKITGKGLDASRTNKMDLISRTADINAKVYANELNLKLGKNTKNIRAGAKKPKVLLDSSALGGMYANSIKLEGTEQGLGVNLPPEIIAGSGGIKIDANGNIVVNNISSSGSLAASSSSGNIKLNNNKTLYSAEELTVKAREGNLHITKDARVLARKKVVMEGKGLNNEGSILSGLETSGKFNSLGQLDLKASGVFNNSGSIVSTGDTAFRVSTLTNKNSGSSVSFGSQRISADALENDGSFEAMANLVLEADNLSNSGNLSSNKSLAVKSKKVLNENGSISSTEALLIDAAKILNVGGTVVSKDIKILGDEFTNDIGKLIASGNISLGSTSTLNKGDIDNKKLSTIIASGSINLDSKKFTNSNVFSVTSAGSNIVTKEDGILVNNGNIIADKISSGDWSSVNKSKTGMPEVDKILASIDGAVSNNKALIAAKSIDITKTKLVADNDLAIKADSSVNLGEVNTKNNLSVVAGDKVSISEKASIDVAGDMNIIANAEINASSSIIEAKSILLASEKVNSGGLSSKESITVIGSDVVNANDEIKAAGLLEIIGTNAVDLKGNISADQISLITDGDIKTKSIEGTLDSNIISKEGLSVSGNISSENININSGGSVVIDGTVQSDADTTIASDKGINLKTDVISGGILALVSKGNTTVSGQVKSGGKQIVSAGKNINVGEIYSEESVDLVSKGRLTVNRSLSSKGNATLGSGENTYLKGNLTVDGNTVLVSDGGAYIYGNTIAGKDVTFFGKNHLYQKGTTFARGDMNLISNGSLSSGSHRTAYGNMVVSSKRNASLSGNSSASKDIYIASDANLYLSGNTTATGNVTLNGKNYLRLYGAARAGKDLNVASNGVVYAAYARDSLTAGKDLNISAGNHAYVRNLRSGKDMTVVSDKNAYIYGNTIAGKDATLYGKNYLYQNGTTYSRGDMSLISGGTLNSRHNRTSGGDMTIYANGHAYLVGNNSSGKEITAVSNRNMYVYGNTTARGDITVDGKNYLWLRNKVVSNNDINLRSDGNITTYSHLIAGNKMKVNAGKYLSLYGAGTVRSVNDMQLTAGKNIHVASSKGAKINRTLSDGTKYTYQRDNVARIQSTRGNVNLFAGENITTIGTILAGAKSLELYAGKSVNLSNANVATSYSKDTIQKNNPIRSAKVTKKHVGYKRFWWWNIPVYEETLSYKTDITSTKKNVKTNYTSAIGSSLSANDKLVVSAGDHLTARGASLKGKKSLELYAGKNLNLANAYTRRDIKTTQTTTGKSYSTEYKRNARFFWYKPSTWKYAGRKVETIKPKTKVKSSRNYYAKKTTLNAGGDIVLSAGDALIAPVENLASKGNLTLSSGQNLNLNKVSAAKDLILHSKKNINVKHSAISGKDLTISSRADVNLAGTVRAGDDLVVAADGNVNLKSKVVRTTWNKTETKTKTVKKYGWHKVKNTAKTTNWWFSWFGNYRYGAYSEKIKYKEKNQGSLYANKGSDLDSTRGNITISAGKNIDSSAATIDAKKSVALLAKGNIALKDARDTYSNKKTVGKKVTNSYHKINKGTQLTAKTGNVLIKSDSNVLMRGKAFAGKNIVVNAKRNVLIHNVDDFSEGEIFKPVVKSFNTSNALQAKQNINIASKLGSVYLGKENLSSHKRKWFDPKRRILPVIDDIISTDNQSSKVKLQAGRELNISSGKDLVMNASLTRSGRDTVLAAKRNLNVNHIENKTEVKRSGGLKRGHWSDTTTKIRNTVADIYSGGNLILKSDGSLNTYGASLRSNKDLSLFAKGTMSLNDVQEQDYYSRYATWKNKSWHRRKHEWRSSANVRNLGTKLQANKSVFINSASTGPSNAKRLTVVKSGDVNLSGTEVKAKDNVNIFSGRNVNMVSGLEFKKSHYKKVKSGLFGVDWLGGSTNVRNAKDTYLGHIEVKSGKDTTVLSTGDIGLLAGRVDANKITFRAGVGSNKNQTASIHVLGDRETKELYTKKVKHKIGLSFSNNFASIASKTKDVKVDVDSVYVGSQLKARDSIFLDAKTDINVVGSSLNAANNILLSAGNDVNLLAAADLHNSKHEHEETRLGVGIKLGGSEAAVWAGVRSVKDVITDVTSLNKGSELIAGNGITVVAGNNLNKVGSYIMAGGDIFQSAANDINELAAVDTRRHTEYHRTLEAGIKLGVKAQGNTAKAISAGTRAVTAQDSKLKAVKAYQAYDAGKQAINGIGQAAVYKAGVSAFVDYSKEESQNTTTSGVANTTIAGGNVSLSAGNAVNLQGSQISAVLDLNLNAADVNISSIRNVTESDSKTTTANAEVTWGTSLSATASAAKNKTKTRSVTHQLASLNAGKNVNLTADNVSITGGKILGQAINATVTNNLRIETEQDSTSFDQSNTSVNASLGTTSSAGANKSKVEADRLAVTEQSGLYASNSLNLNIGNKTTLVGSVIHSDKDDGVNLKTKTLEYINLKNSDEIKASSAGISTSGGINIGNPVSDEKDNITFAAISGGTISTDSDVSGLSRDTENAFTVLDAVKSVTEVQEQQELAGIIAEEGFKKVGDYAAVREAKDKDWADGGWKKTAAHSLMGAVVASVAGGDIAQGALSAGTREAMSGLTADTKSEFLQQVVSTAIGAAIGGEAGAAVALQGEKFNRQLHQKEIEQIGLLAEKQCSSSSAKAECISEWKNRLTKQALKQVDFVWSIGLEQDDEAAKVLADHPSYFTGRNGNQIMFTADSYEFMNSKVYSEFNGDNKALYDAVKKDFNFEQGVLALAEKMEKWDSLSDEEKKKVVADALKRGGERLAVVLEKADDMTGREITEAVLTAAAEGLANDARTVAGASVTATSNSDLLKELYGVDSKAIDDVKAVITSAAVFSVISRKTGGVLDDIVDSLGDKGLYSPDGKRKDYDELFGEENVSSTTNPKKPQQASIKRSDVIVGDDGSRAVRIEMEDGSIKNIPYDERGFPIFDDVTVFTTKIDHSKSTTGQMGQASKDMWDAIKDNPPAKFTQLQLDKMKSGSNKIPGYTWHHNAQSAPNNMQLIPENIHKASSVPHTGQASMKNGN